MELWLLKLAFELAWLLCNFVLCQERSHLRHRPQLRYLVGEKDLNILVPLLLDLFQVFFSSLPKESEVELLLLLFLLLKDVLLLVDLSQSFLGKSPFLLPRE